MGKIYFGIYPQGLLLGVFRSSVGTQKHTPFHWFFFQEILEFSLRILFLQNLGLQIPWQPSSSREQVWGCPLASRGGSYGTERGWKREWRTKAQDLGFCWSRQLPVLWEAQSCGRPPIVVVEARGWERWKALGPIWNQNSGQEGEYHEGCT